MSEKLHCLLLSGVIQTTFIAYSDIIFASSFLITGQSRFASLAVSLVVIHNIYAYL